jgi:hypothetical protein
MFVIKSNDQVVCATSFGRQKKFVADPGLWRAHLFKTRAQAEAYIQDRITGCEQDLDYLCNRFTAQDAEFADCSASYQANLNTWQSAQVVQVRMVEVDPA